MNLDCLGLENVFLGKLNTEGVSRKIFVSTFVDQTAIMNK